MSEMSSEMSSMSSMSSSMTASVLRQVKEGSHAFSKGIPIALLVIPLSLFLMSPSRDKALYAGGALFAFILGLLLVNSNANPGIEKPAFLGNHISFYGIALGYFAGNLLAKAYYEEKLGNMLSVFVMTCILCVVLSWSLYSENMEKVPVEIASSLAGIFFGIIIGMIFTYFSLQPKKVEEEKEKSIMCRTYQDGNLVHSETIIPEEN